MLGRDIVFFGKVLFEIVELDGHRIAKIKVVVSNTDTDAAH